MPSTDNQFSYAIGALALTALLLALPGCGATTSSDMMEARIGKEFNVTGHWTGDLVDSRYGTHEIYLTLNDNGGAVTGTIAVPTHICLGFEAEIGGEWNLVVTEGKATKAGEGTAGDNTFTSTQENSNTGTFDFQTPVLTETLPDENGDEQDIDRILYFTLNGDSDSQTGKFSGTWLGPGLHCRTGLQGAIFIDRT